MDRSPPVRARLSRRAALAGAGAAAVAATAQRRDGMATASAQATPEAATEPLPAGVRAVMAQPRYPVWARWGLHVADRETGEPLFDLAGGERFVPGSVTKLFPASAILLQLGPDHRFETRVVAAGGVVDGVVSGDLILVAAGDPMLGGRTLPGGKLAYGEIDHTDANALPGVALLKTDPLAGLDDLAHQIATAGVRRVEGRVVVDIGLFPQMAKDDDVLSPIVVNDNVVDVLVTAGEAGQPATVAVRPETGAFTVAGRVETVAAGKPAALSVEGSAPGVVRVGGSVAAGGGPSLRTVPVTDPAAFARVLFEEALARAGVGVVGGAGGATPQATGASVARAEPIAVFVSRPLSDLVEVTLKVSMNLYADTLVMLLGAAGDGAGAWERGFTVIRETLVALGIDPAEVSLGDGRGNDRADRFGPRVACDLLRAMAARPEGTALERALPILGVDGTEAGAVPATSPVRGKAAAKSGTTVVGDLLNGQALLLGKAAAGYLTGASGRRVVYASVVNDLPLASIDEIFATVTDQGAIAAALFEAV